MAKGIAGGMPLSGIVGRADLLDSVHPGGLGGTYGGNPVAVAAALETIKFMEEHDLAGPRPRDRGAVLHPHAQAAVRGSGHRGRPRTRRHGGHRTGQGRRHRAGCRSSPRRSPPTCLAEGVLILTCGTYGNVIRLLPPLVIGDELLTEALEVLEAAIRANA